MCKCSQCHLWLSQEVILDKRCLKLVKVLQRAANQIHHLPVATHFHDLAPLSAFPWPCSSDSKRKSRLALLVRPGRIRTASTGWSSHSTSRTSAPHLSP